MAKFVLLSSALLVAVVSGRGINPQTQFNPQQQFGGSMPQGQQPQFGGFMPQGQQPQFGGFMPQGGHGGHGHHGHGGPGGLLPPFLANLTAEALEQFRTIMANEDITKTEMESQLASWAAAQGEATLQAFNEWKEKEKTVKEEISQKAKEIVQNATSVMQQLETISKDISLTRKQEREQMEQVFAGTSRATAFAVKEIGKAAMMEVRPTPEQLSGVQPVVGSFPGAVRSRSRM